MTSKRSLGSDAGLNAVTTAHKFWPLTALHFPVYVVQPEAVCWGAAWGFAALNILISRWIHGNMCSHFENKTSHTAPGDSDMFHFNGRQYVVKCQQATAYPFIGRDLFCKWLVPGSEGWEKKGKTMQCGCDWLWIIHEKWEINSCGRSDIPACLVLCQWWQNILRQFRGKAQSRLGNELARIWNTFILGSSRQNVLSCVAPGVH